MRRLVFVLALAGACAEPFAPVAAPLAVDDGTFFDDTVVRVIEIDIAPGGAAAMEAELAEQLALPIRERDFDYVDCTVRFEGRTWNHVGIRYKGTSSIAGPVAEGSRKFPFKLDFDEFEDLYPETEGQRFFGLKKLSFANGWRDPSLLRDLLTLRVMRDVGVPAPRAVMVAVTIDGTYWGLYTCVEQVDKIFLSDRFGNKSGNLYKPQRRGGALIEFIPDDLEKKTNKGEADWSDIEALITALADPASDIDALIEVEPFLRWIAVSVVLGHYDSYIAARHNYYLYNDPERGKFVFITWDHNVSYGASYPDGFNEETIHTFDPATPWVGPRPLIERVLEKPEHRARYEALIEELLATPLGEDRMDALHEAMLPHVAREQDPFTLQRKRTDFARSLDVTLEASEDFWVPGLRQYLTRRRAWLE